MHPYAPFFIFKVAQLETSSELFELAEAGRGIFEA